MPEIFSVTPGRGRAGHAALVIAGGGFAASSPFGNSVEFYGAAAYPSAQSESEITTDVPGCSYGWGLCISDRWVMLSVMRKDTHEWAGIRWWLKADLSELQTDAKLSEKIPTWEDLDNPTNECLTAATWNRLATFVEFLAHEVLSAKGDLFGRGEAGILRIPVGPNGAELIRVSGGSGIPSGIKWSKPARIWTLHWGRLIDAANARNGSMRANGGADDITTGTQAGTHGMPRPGIIRRLTVNVESASGGDTLDQVVVLFNLAVTLHDSGGGLAIGADGSYQVDIDAWRFTRDLDVRVYKTGTSGTMQLTATLTLEEELRPYVVMTSEEDTANLQDAAVVSDAITAELIQGREAADAIAVADALAVEVQSHRELADTLEVSDSLELERHTHRELGPDLIDVHDSIEAVLL